jgi:hypothetical protein
VSVTLWCCFIFIVKNHHVGRVPASSSPEINELYLSAGWENPTKFLLSECISVVLKVCENLAVSKRDD